MANLSYNSFLQKYNGTLGGRFRSGQVAGIGSDDHRELVVDMLDTFLSQGDASSTSVAVTQLSYATPGSPPAEVDWDLDSKFFNIGILVADYEQISIDFLNEVYGGISTLFVKKTIAGDVTLTVPSSEQVGQSTTFTTITLSGDADTTFKIDFYTISTTGFTPIATTPLTFAKIQHLSETVVVGVSSNKLYKSTDSGRNWTLLYTAPEVNITDFDFDGTSNGCLLSHAEPVPGFNYSFHIYDTTDGGTTWTERYTDTRSVVLTLDNLNQRTISYVGSGDYYVGDSSIKTIGRYNSGTYTIYNALLGTSGYIIRESTRVSTTVYWVGSSDSVVGSNVNKKTGATTFAISASSPFTTSRLFSIAAATANLVVAVGHDSSFEPSIIKTNDGGTTWTSETIDSAIGVLRRVRAVSATSFVCIGDNGLGYSTDSGDTWTYYATPVNGSLLSAWDSTDILVVDSDDSVFKGFEASLGNIFKVHWTEGYVVGPVSATDNAFPRYNLTTGKVIQNSTTVQDDDGKLNVNVTDAGTNTILSGLKVSRTSSGTPTNGIGTSIDVEIKTAAANNEIGYKKVIQVQDNTATTESFSDENQLMIGGVLHSVYGYDPNGGFYSTQYNVGSPVNTFETEVSGSLIPQLATYQDAVTTTNATLTTLHSVDVGASGSLNQNTTIVGYVCGFRTGGSGGATSDSASYKIEQVYKNVGGTITLVGGSVTAIGESNAAWDCQVNISSPSLLIQVQGDTNNNITWYLTELKVFIVR